MNCSVSFTRGQDDTQHVLEWWGLHQETQGAAGVKTISDVEIWAFADSVSNETFSVFAGFGIVGLYVSVVLVVGRFLRMLVTNVSQKYVHVGWLRWRWRWRWEGGGRGMVIVVVGSWS